MSPPPTLRGPRIIVPLDFADADAALAMAARLEPAHCRVKVGKQLFTRAGPAVVSELQSRGYEVFLDLKYHDIPNTVAGACRAAAELGVWMVNVHAGGGRRMLEAAREALEGATPRPLLLGVTVLTSLTNGDLAEVGYSSDAASLVNKLAELSSSCGLDGVVCSPAELAALAAKVPADFLRVTPGVRPAGSSLDDQQRVMTPAEAVRGGASFLVIGRPVTGAADPMRAVADIEAEIRGF